MSEPNQISKLSYKDYLLTLRYSIYRLIELYGSETVIDIFIEAKTDKIISIIEEPKQPNYRKVSTTLTNFLIQTILITNPHLDSTIILLRTYRYIRKQSYADISEATGLSIDEYITLERGNNIHLLNKHKNTILKRLNIPVERILPL